MTLTSVTDLDHVWLVTLQEVINQAAHEVKDSLNGVSLNLEVIRSRLARANGNKKGLEAFAAAAAEQFELLSGRAEAVLYLARPPREPADVAVALKHLATLLVPATKAKGGNLSVRGYDVSVPTSASGQATRLALAAGLLTLTKPGGRGHCRLEQGGGTETVVRFSHESAGTCSIDGEVALAISPAHIRIDQSESDLLLVFPGHS